MAKYLIRGSYTAAGAAGVLREGGMGRAAAIQALVKSLGGTLESIHWAFGAEDFFIITELPDAAAAAVGSLTISASGAANVSTTPLLTASDLDDVADRVGSIDYTVEYRPPGA
jgi:uncharacterized protein with GYD domain